ncbi:hypothetical protein ACFFTM_03980 [Pseudoduganella plicata]|uniref:Uncharacterized protein n=1 Tax=Pseudoduganella plicata TaxID=321984 RepID=A0AA87YCF0_9BURK|nr:hypothetical protein [Pseudoduganella plicata]GGZ07425.1 hypothetical protein GCM10007388_46140 [Pseudoduganella plicata]
MINLLRHHAARRHGTVCYTVMHSIVRGEWPELRARLDDLLTRER